MIPEGQYTAKARTWDLGFTSTGKPQVAVEFVIQGGEYAGQSRTWFGMFGQGKSRDGSATDLSKRTIESLRYCGWTGDDVTDLTGLDRNNVQIVIRHETYQGKTNDRIAFVNQLNNGVALKRRMGDAEKAAFAAKLKGRCMSVPKDLAVSTSYEEPLPPSDTNWDIDHDEFLGF